MKRYAFGGMPKGGGEIQGPSHDHGGVPFNANAEAEGKELYIINKRSAALNRRITVSGTPRQIASAVNSVGGGVNFSPGASLTKLAEGGFFSNKMPGANLHAPINPQAYINPSGSTGAIDDVYKAIAQQTANINTLAMQTNQRIDKIQVQVVAKEVEDTNTRTKKAKSIGTI